MKKPTAHRRRPTNTVGRLLGADDQLIATGGGSISGGQGDDPITVSSTGAKIKM